MSEIPEIEGVEEVNLIAKIKSKPDFVDDVVKIMTKLAEESLEEEGNTKYELFQEVGSNTTIIVVEKWKSRKDLELHFESKHFKNASEEMEGKVDSMGLTYLAKL